MAIHEVRDKCLRLSINRITDADVSGFFDNMNHNLLQDIIRQRVNDGGTRRLIGKWPNAGVPGDGNLSRSESGTPQRGVISPLLANIFLHNAPDDWFVKEVRPRMKGRCLIIRWADDFIIGLEVKSDAVRIMEVLPKRSERFGLSLNMRKTKLVKFGKPDKAGKYKPETSDFPGFTFYWAKSLRGFWVIRKKTAEKRLMRFVRTPWDRCMRNRHNPLKEQHKALCEKLPGYFRHFGVRSNHRALETVRNHAVKAWRFRMSRRSHRGGLSWEKSEKIISDFPLPLPRIIRNI